MKLPQSLLDSPYAVFSNIEELIRAVGTEVDEEEQIEIRRLDSIGLTPITSISVLAAMFGINPGLIGAIIRKPSRYYRTFAIPKGNSTRLINAPKVALKIIQKWLSVRLSEMYAPPRHVFGFVPGKSHIYAAKIHAGAKWTFSIDIHNFFQTTPKELVASSLESYGFGHKGANLIAAISCLSEVLAQGAPSSPVLSNMCIKEIDARLVEIANKYSVRLTRYADDIVFSGDSSYPEGLKEDVESIFNNSCWTLSEKKTELCFSPRDRLKVHGILVHGEQIRLTKGYRNKIRAYKHLMLVNKVQENDINKISGHLKYAEQVSLASQ